MESVPGRGSSMSEGLSRELRGAGSPGAGGGAGGSTKGDGATGARPHRGSWVTRVLWVMLQSLPLSRTMGNIKGLKAGRTVIL